VSLSTSKSCSCNDAVMLGACCCALASLVPVAMYQLGAIESLPDPNASVFDSDRITSSKAAHPFGIPDSLLGIASFSTTLALILLAKKHKSAKKLLGAKLAMDASAAAFNASRQLIEFGKICSWCSGTALSAGIMAYAGRAHIRDGAQAARKAYKEIA
jgi:uncharacterized membrane protein